MKQLIVDNGEQILSLREFARVAPVKRTVHQYRRWIVNGMRTASGSVVHLEHIRIGRAYATSVPALQRFLKSLQG